MFSLQRSNSSKQQSNPKFTKNFLSHSQFTRENNKNLKIPNQNQKHSKMTQHKKSKNFQLKSQKIIQLPQMNLKK